MIVFEGGGIMVLSNDALLSPLGPLTSDWKGEDFLKELHSKPKDKRDHGRDGIFNASQLAPGQPPAQDLNRCPYQ